MTIERYPVTDRSEWLARRRQAVNASEIGALFGEHPYLTAYEMFADKTGAAVKDELDDGVLWRGQIFEPAAAQAVALRKPAWRISKAEHWLFDPAAHIGATPDYFVECPQRGRGVLQIKTVGTLPDQMTKWQVTEKADWEELAQPPLWVQLQTLTEQRQADVTWGAIGALLLDPNNPRIAIREFDRHTAAESRIVSAVAAFWDDVRARRAPAADYSRDADVIKALYPRDDGSTVDLSADTRLLTLLERREHLAAQRGPVEKELEAINAELIEKLGDATYGTLPGWRLSRKLQTRKAIPASEFRVLRVSRIKEKTA